MSEGPNYRLQIIRIRHSLMQQELALFKQKLDKMEALDRITHAEENEQAHKRSIDDFKKQLAELEATHGKFDAADVDAAAKAALAAGDA